MLASNVKVRPKNTKKLVGVFCLAAALGMTPVLHAEKPPWPAAAEEKVSLALTAASLVDVVSTLATVSDVPIPADARLLQRTVNLAAVGLPLHQVLERPAAAAGAKLRWRDGAAVLTPKPGSTTPPSPPRRRTPPLGVGEPPSRGQRPWAARVRRLPSGGPADGRPAGSRRREARALAPGATGRAAAPGARRP